MSNRLLYVLNIVILSLIYLIAAKIGLRFNAGFATFVWLPIGIGLAALLLYGYRLWPGIAIGSFAASFLIGGTWSIALGISVGNTLEIFAGVYILQNYVKLNYTFKRLRDSVGFLLVALIIPIIGATIGIITLWLSEIITPATFNSAWVIWWFGDVLGILTITPFLICWLPISFFWKSISPKLLVEGALVLLLLLILDVTVFLTPYWQWGYLPVIYLTVVPFMWLAIRTGSRGITLSIALSSCIGLLAVIFNHGVFSQEEIIARFFATGTFLSFISLIFIPFTSVVAEEKNTADILRENMERLREALQKISSEDAAKNEFLAILAHELRNPLSPVVSSLELMNIKIGEIDRPDILRIIKTSESHVQTIVHLLDDLLDISRISHKKFKLEKETVELQSIVYHAQETVDVFYTSRNHRLSISMPKKPIWISADPVRIEQALNNILYNAAKYTDMGGLIKLSVSQDNKKQEVIIRMRDNGMGIESDMIEKIFEPFFQENPNNNSRVGTGLGIGLALTKRLVEHHGGNIRAMSEGLDKGSEFIITLPTVQHSQLQTKVPTKDRRKIQRSPYFTFRPLQGKKERPPVLIVDDNKDAADALKTLLEYFGYKALAVYSGRETLETAREINPEAVILDIGLPDMSGYVVAELLRKEFGGSLTLIALTGYGQNKDKLGAIKAGFNHHLIKPIRINEIRDILNKTLSNR